MFKRYDDLGGMCFLNLVWYLFSTEKRPSSRLVHMHPVQTAIFVASQIWVSRTYPSHSGSQEGLDPTRQNFHSR